MRRVLGGVEKAEIKHYKINVRTYTHSIIEPSPTEGYKTCILAIKCCKGTLKFIQLSTFYFSIVYTVCKSADTNL